MRKFLIPLIALSALAFPVAASAQGPSLDNDSAATATNDYLSRNARTVLGTQAQGRVSLLDSDSACRVLSIARPPRGLCVFHATIQDRVRVDRNGRGGNSGHDARLHGTNPPRHDPQPRPRPRPRVRVLTYECIGATSVRGGFFRPSVRLITSDCVRNRAQATPIEDDPVV